MKIKRLTFVAFASGLMLLLVNPAYQVQAQSRICPDDGNYAPASSTYKTVKLPDFGMEVDIPSNYRTMKRQDGSVVILHPDDYEFIQCVARGGQGGRGFSSESIELVDRDNSKTLREQAVGPYGDVAEVLEYEKGNLSGYIVTSQSGYGVGFLGRIPGRQQLLRIDASCDCEVEIKDLTDLLSRVRLMN